MTWLHTLWFGYFYPSLRGNGPEDLIATFAGIAIGAKLWPRVKKGLHKTLEEHHGELHEKLDHIIFHHPEIPPLRTDASSPRQPPST